jgi:hypothetical protein
MLTATQSRDFVRRLALVMAAHNAAKTGNVLPVERKPSYGVDSEYIDPGVRTGTVPQLITHYKDGTIEKINITPGSKVWCAMQAHTESQVRAIAKQW